LLNKTGYYDNATWNPGMLTPLVLKNPPFTVISDRFISAFSSFPMHVSLALARRHLEIEVFDSIILSHDPLPDLGIKSRVTLVLQYYFTGLVP